MSEGRSQRTGAEELEIVGEGKLGRGGHRGGCGVCVSSELGWVNSSVERWLAREKRPTVACCASIEGRK